MILGQLLAGIIYIVGLIQVVKFLKEKYTNYKKNRHQWYVAEVKNGNSETKRIFIRFK